MFLLPMPSKRVPNLYWSCGMFAAQYATRRMECITKALLHEGKRAKAFCLRLIRYASVCLATLSQVAFHAVDKIAAHRMRLNHVTERAHFLGALYAVHRIELSRDRHLHFAFDGA